MADQTVSGHATPAAMLSQQPAGLAQLLSLFFYPFTFLPTANSAMGRKREYMGLFKSKHTCYIVIFPPLVFKLISK